jgi:hypothetical protein
LELLRFKHAEAERAFWAGNGPAIFAGWPQTRDVSGAEILHNPMQIAMAFAREKSREAVVYVLPKKRIGIRALAKPGAVGAPVS